MRLKIWVCTFPVFSEAIQWTVHENMYLEHSTSTSYSYSTLEEAQAKCAEIDECDGITNYKWTGYRLRYGALLASPQSSWPEYTWMKSFIQWSEHVGYGLHDYTSYGSGRFSNRRLTSLSANQNVSINLETHFSCVFKFGRCEK